MTTYNFGDVVVVKILFSDQSAAKPRPAVVISNSAYHSHKPDIIIASITSDLKMNEAVGEFVLSDRQRAGLNVSSRVKAFVSTIDPRLVKYGIGKLGDTDMQSLRTMLQKLFL